MRFLYHSSWNCHDLSAGLVMRNKMQQQGFFVRPKHGRKDKSENVPDNIIISGGSSGPVQATQLSNAANLALPLSITWVGAIQKKCGGADLDGLGNISFSDLAILVLQ